MKTEFLKNERIKEFTTYCKKHRSEVDDSFLYDEDLQRFLPGEDNPTYIVTNEQEEIIAAASLVINDYNRRGRTARFRIFHSEIDNNEIYSMLMKGILKHSEGLDKLTIFVPTVNEKLIKSIEELRFMVERYAFLLMREDLEETNINLPEGYEIRAFEPGKDEKAWCDVRNSAFAKLQGHETPITKEMVSKMTSESDYLEGGMMILYHYGRPVGVVRGADDEYEGSQIMNIGPVAVIPEYQGKGLGRCLLRASLRFAKEKLYERTILSVNAANERAKALYIQEGFKQVESVVCYKYDLS